jgi:uncharacterized protein YcaQ
MTNDLLTLSPALARRLVILRQRLAGPRPQANAAGIMDIVRDLGCLQLDPTNVVARSHLLVLLLSPFDNLICDRKRTEQLFDFSFRLEIYTPKAKRQYGFYVLPILHGDRLIGRVDPAMDRARGRLTVNAIYAEPGAPATRKTGQAVANAIQELGAFLGATEIAYKRRVPAIWKHTFC